MGAKLALLLGFWLPPQKSQKTNPCSTCSGGRAFAGSYGLGKPQAIASMALKRTLSPLKPNTSAPMFRFLITTTAPNFLALIIFVYEAERDVYLCPAGKE